MKTVILAEKPDQARKIKQAYDQGNFPNLGSVRFVNARGHLYELIEPEQYNELWNRQNSDGHAKSTEEILAALPIFPDKFKHRKKQGVSKLLNDISIAVKEADQIIIATDPDVEGAGIAWSILNRIPGVAEKKILQLEYKAQTIPDFQAALAKPTDALKYKPMAEQSLAREESDWLVGMNVSRLVTSLLRIAGYNGNFPVGRVQTPTVKKIVDRELEILNYDPDENWRIMLNDEGADVTFSGVDAVGEFRQSKGGYDAAETFYNKMLAGTSTVVDVIREARKESAPQLYKFSKLQADASRRFKWQPKQTAEVYQWLYENGWVSYPRTDEQKIAPSEFEYLLQNVQQLLQLIGHEDMELVQTQPRKRYVSSDGLDHSANIPSQQIPTVEQLDSWEESRKQLYLLIVERTMLMFADDVSFNQTIVTVENSGYQFKTNGRFVTNPGWSKYWQQEKKDKQLPGYQKGQSLDLTPKMHQIAPPKRYTEADMTDHVMDAMGIGRPSTQSVILEKITQTYINREEKHGELSPKPSAFVLVAFLDGTLLTKPEMTAKWEEYLDQIGAGVPGKSEKQFVSNIEKFISKQIGDLPERTGNFGGYSASEFNALQASRRNETETELETPFGTYFATVANG